MTIKLLNNDSIVCRTIGRIIGVLFKPNGDLLITFEDYSDIEIKKGEYYGFFVERD